MCVCICVCKHFPRRHKLHKIFNRTTLKVSYSGLKNTKNILNNHNSKKLDERIFSCRTCICSNKNKCPLHGKCLHQNIVFEGLITSTQPHFLILVLCKRPLDNVALATSNLSMTNTMKKIQNCQSIFDELKIAILQHHLFGISNKNAYLPIYKSRNATCV